VSEVVAVIPARGGSKAIPRKNVVAVGGRPLIAYTIEAARAARSVDRVIVSTEDAEIAEVARAWGAEVPFMRPSELARDDTPGIDPLLHAAEWLCDHGGAPAYVLLLQATSPLRRADDIDAAVALAHEHDAEAVVAVTPMHHHPYWCKILGPDGRLSDAFPAAPGYVARQALPSMMAIAGALYLVKTDVLRSRRTFYTDRTYGYVLPAERALDIDTPWDLHVFEALVQAGSTLAHAREEHR
jgi:CMP-N,N'-diacetyllegionaminic acid synthase